MTQGSLDIQALAQFQLNFYIAEQSESASHYEIDSTDDIFGKLYRVWGGEKGINLLGTFYQNLEGLWVSQPCNSDKRDQWYTDSEAINAILTA
ncbi:hypothetical protein VF14_03325 [Nostoc linckia z18]|uniref:Uncharacterized protein n=2 Tax=Nostoc linckia TaxID=92942 RepID=A0A9Q6ENG0_NOSLI|nr:hypothetical protein [Nostoc linckia]PHK42407.1 hypothetical protein VF12_03340 [Nostoc linckia z15]PHK46915.1 hypothetical protein VF13_07965 [Nostoc linckia z16]PHJ69177.1 hypothetical protein VF02_00795 [Nostoc linckia z1]PHJ73328.1 hypothetical protein VF05_01810 [Nostoc linckia z3]PHJ78675.1 hypothetical protein VF03_00795 [Nostoc linckia z2]